MRKERYKQILINSFQSTISSEFRQSALKVVRQSLTHCENTRKMCTSKQGFTESRINKNYVSSICCSYLERLIKVCRNTNLFVEISYHARTLIFLRPCKFYVECQVQLEIELGVFPVTSIGIYGFV